MTQLNSPAKCPTCGSREREVRNCVVENCGESHVEPTAFSRTHRRVVCSDCWHHEPAAPPEGETVNVERCAVCGWLLSDSRENGCVKGDCSLRPFPYRFYDIERAEIEYGHSFPRAWHPSEVVASPAMSAEQFYLKNPNILETVVSDSIFRFAEAYAAALTAEKDKRLVAFKESDRKVQVYNAQLRKCMAELEAELARLREQVR